MPFGCSPFDRLMVNRINVMCDAYCGGKFHHEGHEGHEEREDF